MQVISSQFATYTGQAPAIAMRYTLKEINRPDLYQYTSGLIWKVTGQRMPPISEETLREAERMFIKFDFSGVKVYYPFLIHKILSHLVPGHFVLSYVYLQSKKSQTANARKVYRVLGI
jgi:ABC-type oligopeptide transport system substrate-binding subunit